jgi:8-oxo-dGTP diphosphatase
MKRNIIPNIFNIRVYSIIFNKTKDSVLVSDEYQMDLKMTKFPGGGLMFGESTIDCLKREAIEEFKQEIEVVDHFYTTDFFQKSIFSPNQQVISIYYIAQFKDEIWFKVSEKAFDFKENINGNMSFRWLKLNNISADDFTLPIDKKVAEMLKARS